MGLAPLFGTQRQDERACAALREQMRVGPTRIYDQFGLQQGQVQEFRTDLRHLLRPRLSTDDVHSDIISRTVREEQQSD